MLALESDSPASLVQNLKTTRAVTLVITAARFCLYDEPVDYNCIIHSIRGAVIKGHPIRSRRSGFTAVAGSATAGAAEYCPL